MLNCKRKGHPLGDLFPLLAVLAVVTALIAVLVLLGILSTVVILIIHEIHSFCFGIAVFRLHSISNLSGFILGLPEKAGNQSRCSSHGNASGSCFQAAGKNTQETVLVYSLFHTGGQKITKTG